MRKNITLVLNIVRNWSAYLFGFPRPIPVGYVIIAVTYACNARCTMCNLHKHYQKHPDLFGKEVDLALVSDTLKKSSVLRNVHHIDLTGGEPFLKKDLKQFIKQLFDLPSVDLVSINTNGLLPNKITDDVQWILAHLKTDQRFSISISIDGIGELHDTIRGVPGSFDKIEKTVASLSKLQTRHCQFKLRSNAVIQPANLHALEPIKSYWEKHNISGAFGVIQTPFYTHSSAQNTYNDIKEFNKEDLAIVKSATPKSRGMNDYLSRGCIRPLHCFAGFTAMCIDPFGTLYPCNFLTGCERYQIGNIHREGIDAIWTSSRSRSVRKVLKTCPYTHCWNGCEVDQTLIQFDPIDKMMRILSCGLVSYYRLKGLRDVI
jgi:Fe-coproporphyrin III synthase